ERHTYQLLRKFERGMESAAVFQKFLSMVGSNCQGAFIPDIEFHEFFRQPADLNVSPADASVIQGYYLVSFLAEAVRANVVPDPKRIQISGFLGRDSARFHLIQCFPLGAVRSVRIRQMQPETEGAI